MVTLKISRNSTALVPAYSLLKQEQLQLAQASFRDKSVFARFREIPSMQHPGIQACSFSLFVQAFMKAMIFGCFRVFSILISSEIRFLAFLSSK